MNSEFLISEIFKRLSFLETELKNVKAENAQLLAKNTILNSRVIELESRLKSNSSNSSKPPSSDGYQKKPAFAKKFIGKKGGQKGHKGNNLHQVPKPDKIVKCLPDICSCGHEFHQDEFTIAEKRQVLDHIKKLWIRIKTRILFIPIFYRYDTAKRSLSRINQATITGRII